MVRRREAPYGPVAPLAALRTRTAACLPSSPGRLSSIAGTRALPWPPLLQEWRLYACTNRSHDSRSTRQELQPKRRRHMDFQTLGPLVHRE